MFRSTISIAAVGSLLLSAANGQVARGDVLELVNGGRIEGRLVEDAGDRAVYVIETAGGRVSIPRAAVAAVSTTSELEKEYAELARTSPDTVEAHWTLAEWCRERRLRDQAQQHLERILELEPDHDQARTLLGYRKHDGQWMTRDALMESRGLVWHEGRYRTRQHIELMQQQQETSVSEGQWTRRLDLLRRWLTGSRQDRVEQALAEIEAIDDPAAAAGIARLLRREEDPGLLRLWIEVAGRLDQPATVDVLVKLSLEDPDEEVRHTCLEHLIRSGRPGLVTPYVRALKSTDNVTINRAAAALGQIGDPEAIGPLIGALVTKHRFQVGGGNPGQHAYSFSPDSGAFSFGGGGPQFETRALRNPAVLSALVQLSRGTSFDYDQRQWRAWLAAQERLQRVDVRRDE